MTAVMANYGGLANPPKSIVAEMYADPWFNPNNLWSLFVSAFGRAPTSDEASGLNDTAPMFFYAQPEFQKYVKETQDYWIKNGISPTAEAYATGGYGPDPWANMGGAGAAEGAFITEPMLAFGKSGRRLWIGEKGTEYVGPIKSRDDVSTGGDGNQGNVTYQFIFQGPVYAEEQYVADKLYPIMEKFRKYGH
jgi:hypothetical protein